MSAATHSCPFCSKAVAEDTRVCRHCGTPLPDRLARAEVTRPQSAPSAVTPERRSTLGLVAAEVEDAGADLGDFLRRLSMCDWITLLALLGLLASAFMPWQQSQLGLFAGGSLALFLAWWIGSITVRRQRLVHDMRGEIGADTETEVKRRVRRLNLLQIGLGFAEVCYLLSLVLVYFWREESRFDVRYGWFVAVLSAAGLAYGGLARFVRDARA